MSNAPEGFARTEDGCLLFKRGRSYTDPGEAVVRWWDGKLVPTCSERVFRSWHSTHCDKPPKYDPDANGRPTKCGLHCAAAKHKREAKLDARRAKWDAQWKAKSALDKAQGEIEPALKRIAEGHNDPRSLAQEVLQKLEEARAALDQANNL